MGVFSSVCSGVLGQQGEACDGVSPDGSYEPGPLKYEVYMSDPQSLPPEKTAPQACAAAVPEIPEPNPSSPSGRIISVDALRGFDMFWIIGIDEVIWAAEKAWPNTFTHVLAAPLKHCEWDGFSFYDLIFPLFVFLVGVSTVFSLTKTLQQENRAAPYKRIFRRFLLLYLAALVHDGAFWGEHFRLLGVLQRIAWCYLITALLFCHLKFRGLLVVFFGILISYWALLSFVPPPGEPSPTFAIGRTWPNYIDLHYLPSGSGGRHGWINEGILSTVPAVATCLLGLFAGMLLRRKNVGDKQKVAGFVICGTLLVAVGYLWGLQFPVIKRIWTSTYVLVAGGYSCVLLGLFYLIIDVYKRKKWAAPFVRIGSNSITAYVVCGAFPWWIGLDPLDGFLQPRLGDAAEVVNWSIITVGVFLLICVLYRKKVFLRL